MVTIGSDVELFIKDLNGKLVLANKIVEETKENPRIVTVNNNIFKVHKDGAAIEYSIPICHTEEEFVKFHLEIQDYIKSILPPEYTLVFEATALLEEDQMNDKDITVMGCDPDKNPYNKTQNPTPDSSLNFRAAGGHIHFGYENHKENINANIMRWCDMYLGLPSVCIDPDKLRRSLYGKAGAYRNKPYGVEYRTLSNYMFSNEELLRFVYKNAVLAFEKGIDEYLDPVSLNSFSVQSAINNYAFPLAKTIIEENNIPIIEYQYA